MLAKTCVKKNRRTTSDFAVRRQKESSFLPSELNSRFVESKILGLDQNVRASQVGIRKHHDSAVVQIAGVLLAQLVDIASVKSAVRATCNACGLVTVGTQTIAAVALAGNTLLREVLRMTVRAAHNAHTAADALALILDNSAIGSLADSTRGAVRQANRILAMVAAARVAVRLDRKSVV